jgi:hypothetical protein
MYSIAVRFSTMQVRMAVLHVLLQTFHSLNVLVVASSMAVSVYVMHAVDIVGSNTLLSATIGISVGLIGWMVLIAVMYVVNMRFLKRMVQTLPNTSVTYHLSSGGCAVSSDAWNGFLPWHSFGRLVWRPSMLLLEIVEQRPGEEMAESLRAALRTTPADVATAAQTRAFPIFWVLPVPFRTFLALPAAALSEEQQAFIKNMLKHRSRKAI